MKPELASFFGTMERLFAEPRQLPQLHAAEPGWTAPVSRVAIYTRFVEGHVRSTLEKVYPLTAALLGPAFPGLADDYYRTRPARHFEMNHLAEGFVSFLADRAQHLEPLPHLLPLARFEWTDFSVYAAPVDLPEPVAQPTVNPTLAILQHPFALCAFVAATPSERPAAPRPAEETALLWRHPETQRTTFVPADPRRLLALKLVVEGRSTLEQAAAEAGTGVALLSEALHRAADEGFVLLPKTRTSTRK